MTTTTMVVVVMMVAGRTQDFTHRTRPTITDQL